MAMYGMAARYAEEMERMRRENEALGITDEMMTEAGADAPYNLTPAQQRARYADPDAGRGALKSQRAFANMLRGSKLPELKKVGPSGISVMNKWEGLETMFNRIAGGYLSGKADKKEAALDENRATLRQALAAKEEAEFGMERGDVALEQALAGRKQDYTEGAEGRGDRARILDQANFLTNIDEKAGVGQDLAYLKAGLGERQGEIDAEEATALQELRGEQRLEQIQLVEDLDKGTLTVGQTGGNEVQTIALNNLKSATERKSAGINLATYHAFGKLIGAGKEMVATGEGYEGSGDWVVAAGELVGGWLGDMGAKMGRDTAKGWVYSDAERVMRGDISLAFEQFRRAQTGANLTAIETTLMEDQDPTAPGISLGEAIGRMERLQVYINDSNLTKYGIPKSEVAKVEEPAAGGPEVGAVQDGYRFKGGDPKDKDNWEQV